MKIRVMVVEDEPPIQRNICQKIEEINSSFQVVATADNGREAYRYLQEHTVDVLFVDMNLPVMNGQELLHSVAQQNMKLIPVVLSGYTDFTYVKSAFENNALDYLLKPLKDSELKLLLERLEEKLQRQWFEEKAHRFEEALSGAELPQNLDRAAEAGRIGETYDWQGLFPEDYKNAVPALTGMANGIIPRYSGGCLWMSTCAV